MPHTDSELDELYGLKRLIDAAFDVHDVDAVERRAVRGTPVSRILPYGSR